MQSTNSIIKQLKIDYPQFSFKEASDFSWSHNEHTVYYCHKDKDHDVLLLHELAHGLLNHTDYQHDIELIAMERAAWDKTKELATNYSLSIDDDLVQSFLDSYRNWLHARSTCPKCNDNGIQTTRNTYKCLACSHNWKVNEAKICALRRYNKKL